MKRIAAAVLMGMMMLSGCGSSASQTADLPSGNLEEAVEQLSLQYEMTMPNPVDDTFLQKIFGIDPEDTVQYAGRLSMSAASADSVMAVQPVPGKEDEVRQALEERLEFVRESFRQFQPESYEKAQAGTVCQQGDSYFLLILGREGEEPAQEIQAAQEDLEDLLKE